MKILIAGAGIAGSVLTRMLRDRGHEVGVADRRPDKAASRCAFAYLRTAWWTGEEKRRVRDALAWYDQRGWVLAHEATVHDLRRGKVTKQSDHYLIDPAGPLVRADFAGDVTGYQVYPGEVAVQMAGTFEMQVDRLVLACGSGMDRWSTGTPTYGAVYEAPGRCMSGTLRLLRVTDRMTHVAAAGDRITRLGASKARTPQAARARAEAILNRMLQHNIVDAPAPWTLREGVRWENLTGPAGGRRLDDRVWAFTGFARSGYATVPAAARDLVKELEQ